MSREGSVRALRGYCGANSGPNGICFSPDYKKVYIADTGGGREIKVWDIDGKTIRNGKRFVQLDIPGLGTPSAADGARFLAQRARPGDRVLTIGAGDVDRAAALLLELLG